MSKVQVFQRNARLAGPVLLDFVKGRNGMVPKALFTAISNSPRRKGDGYENEPTAIAWTVWGRRAETAANCLVSGSPVNVVGHVRHNDYTKADGTEVRGFEFIADEIDFLESRADKAARVPPDEFVAAMEDEQAGNATAHA